MAVVILNWNGIHHLQQFLPSVCSSTYPHLEIILADNASTDDSVSWVRQSYPAVKILKSDVNYGYAGGYNYFLKQIEADYYVLLNSDVEVMTSWIEPVIALMEAHHNIAACQPKILSYNQREYFEYAGAAGGWLDSLGYPFSRGRVFDTIEKDQGQYDQAVPIFWASGAAFFIRARNFHEAGGFNALFFAHQEEIDLCWRLQQAGFQIYVCPQSVVYHLGGGTLTPQQPKKIFLNYRNNLIMVVRNWPLYQLWWKLPLRLLLDVISAWKSLLTGNFQYWLAVAQAHLAFFGWLIKNITSIGRSRQSPSAKGLFRGSIVWQYFILGKKYFSQIVKIN